MLGQTGQAPYAPAKAVLAVLDVYRDKFLPTPVTPAVLERAGVESSLTQRTLAALKQLDLLDSEGNPTETLSRIKTAPTDELSSVLSDWIRSVYAPIFQFVDATDSVQRISDQFRHYEPAGMRNRMVTLFLGLCVRAGILAEMPTLPRNQTGATSNGGATKPREPRKTAPKSEAKAEPTPSTHDGHSQPNPASLDELRQRYIDLLISKAAEQPDPELLDRIERALGIGGGSP